MKTGTKVGNNVITAALLCVHALSYLTFVTAGTVDCQAPLSMEFSRQEYGVGCLLQAFPSPGDLLNPGIEPRSPALQADSLLSEPPGKPLLDGNHCNRVSQAPQS